MPEDPTTADSEPGGGRAKTKPAPEPRARAEAATPPRLASGRRSPSATAVPALLFFVLPPLTRSGLWDPYELNVADLVASRRANLFHAGNLALDGADNSLPHLNDLGRPQLPFSSIALGFKLFGLHEWAGRLPLALWGLLGVLATYAFVARLFDRRTGAYAAVVLADDAALLRPGPLDARRHLHDGGPGDGVRRPRGRGVRPAAGEGGRRPSSDRPARARSVARDGARSASSSGSRAAAGCSGWACRSSASASRGRRLAWPRARQGSATRWATPWAPVARRRGRGGGRRWPSAASPPRARTSICGSARSATRRPSTRRSTSTSAAIGHAMAPWSAFLPFAFGRLLLTPAPGGREAADGERSARAWRAWRCSSAPPWRSWRTPSWSLAPISSCSPARRSARSRAPWRSATSSAARTRRSPWASGRSSSPRSCTTTSTSCPRRPTRRSASPTPRSPRASRTRRSPSGGSSLGGFALCALLTWVERDADARAVRPGELRQGPARAARGVRRHPRARVLRDHRGRVGRGAPRRHRDADARALAAADVVDDPRPGPERVVAHLVHPARRSSSGSSSRATCGSGRSAGPSRSPSASLTRGFEPFEGLLAKLFPAARASPRCRSTSGGSRCS